MPCDFDDLIDADVKACEDDIKGLKRACPSTKEVRDRVVAYLEDIAKHKCSNQSKKEADEKRILGRMGTFRLWIRKEWDSIPLSKCREASFLRNALIASDGILRAVHFIDRTEEHNLLKYTEDVAADGDGLDNLEDDDFQYDEFHLLCDLYNGHKVDSPGWMVYELWCTFAIWTAYECWQISLRKTSHTTTQIFHLPFNFHRVGSSGFRLADRCRDTDDDSDLFHPKVRCTKSMVNWDVVAKVHSHSVPDYTDVLPDPFPSTSRLPALLDLLQNQHAGLLERVKKHLSSLPGSVQRRDGGILTRERPDGIGRKRRVWVARTGLMTTSRFSVGTVLSGFRGLLIWDNMVCFMSYYHKSQALTGRRKWIARFLHPGFSDTFINWVAFVRPAQAYFYRAIGYPTSATLIEDNLWTTGGNIV
ncbi:hypothetical protein D1P53_005938 [Cryptococcus gattii VGV]|nr:hypothetical protein D1P53_005938 [Cryptococcus gattii VGV]